MARLVEGVYVIRGEAAGHLVARDGIREIRRAPQDNWAGSLVGMNPGLDQCRLALYRKE